MSEVSTYPCPFQLTLQQPLVNLMSLSRSSWGHPGMRKMVVRSNRVELGVPSLGSTGQTSQPKHRFPAPPLIFLPAHSSVPGWDSSVNEQITPRQTASVCSLPSAASALCQTFLWVLRPSLWPFSRGCFQTQRQGVAPGD